MPLYAWSKFYDFKIPNMKKFKKLSHFNKELQHCIVGVRKGRTVSLKMYLSWFLARKNFLSFGEKGMNSLLPFVTKSCE